MTELVIHELAYYEALAAENHRGLVAMLFQENAMPYVVGDVAGFPPRNARAMHAQGQAVPYFADDADRPADMPVQRAAAPSNAAEIARLDALDVSLDIFEESKLAWIALAKKILNVHQNTGGITATKADAVIRAELARRAAREPDPTGGALTSRNPTSAVPPGAGAPGSESHQEQGE